MKFTTACALVLLCAAACTAQLTVEDIEFDTLYDLTSPLEGVDTDGDGTPDWNIANLLHVSFPNNVSNIVISGQDGLGAPEESGLNQDAEWLVGINRVPLPNPSASDYDYYFDFDYSEDPETWCIGTCLLSGVWTTYDSTDAYKPTVGIWGDLFITVTPRSTVTEVEAGDECITNIMVTHSLNHYDEDLQAALAEGPVPVTAGDVLTLIKNAPLYSEDNGYSISYTPASVFEQTELSETSTYLYAPVYLDQGLVAAEQTELTAFDWGMETDADVLAAVPTTATTFGEHHMITLTEDVTSYHLLELPSTHAMNLTIWVNGTGASISAGLTPKGYMYPEDNSISLSYSGADDTYSWTSSSAVQYSGDYILAVDAYDITGDATTATVIIQIDLNCVEAYDFDEDPSYSECGWNPASLCMGDNTDAHCTCAAIAGTPTLEPSGDAACQYYQVIETAEWTDGSITTAAYQGSSWTGIDTGINDIEYQIVQLTTDGSSSDIEFQITLGTSEFGSGYLLAGGDFSSDSGVVEVYNVYANDPTEGETVWIWISADDFSDNRDLANYPVTITTGEDPNIAAPEEESEEEEEKEKDSAASVFASIALIAAIAAVFF